MNAKNYNNNVKIAEEKSNEICMVVRGMGGRGNWGHVQEVINCFLVAHSAIVQIRRENVFMNLNSHDVICFINSKRRKILITKKQFTINSRDMTVLFTNEMCI